MRVRSLLVLLVIGLIAAFAVLNWSAFSTPTWLSLGFVTFQAPLGLLMLALMAVLTMVFVVYMAVWQGTVLMETRKHAKDLQAQRTIAEQSEASRFTELRAVLQLELEKMAERITKSQEALRSEITESANSLAAMIGEIDDRNRGRRGDAVVEPGDVLR